MLELFAACGFIYLIYWLVGLMITAALYSLAGIGILIGLAIALAYWIVATLTNLICDRIEKYVNAHYVRDGHGHWKKRSA